MQSVRPELDASTLPNDSYEACFYHRYTNVFLCHYQSFKYYLFHILYIINMLFFCFAFLFCFSEIQFLEQNYDIAKCSIWMKKVTEIQNKVV